MRRLLGSDAVSRRGERLGRIVDVAIEPMHGAIAFIAVRYGDDESNGKTFLVPLAACHVHSDRVVLDVEPTVFARSPGRR